MTKDEILDTIDLLGEGLDHLPDWVIRKRYNDDSITKAREYLKELQSSSPPPRPAIPEDVRKALKYALAFASADAALSDHPSVQALSNDFGFARAWLAQCPTATDKAVCPKCGYQRFRIDKNIAECISCGHKFEVILVISPPREVKP